MKIRSCLTIVLLTISGVVAQQPSKLDSVRVGASSQAFKNPGPSVMTDPASGSFILTGGIRWVCRFIWDPPKSEPYVGTRVVQTVTGSVKKYFRPSVGAPHTGLIFDQTGKWFYDGHILGDPATKTADTIDADGKDYPSFTGNALTFEKVVVDLSFTTYIQYWVGDGATGEWKTLQKADWSLKGTVKPKANGSGFDENTLDTNLIQFYNSEDPLPPNLGPKLDPNPNSSWKTFDE